MVQRRSVAVCLASVAIILLVLGCVALFTFPYVVRKQYNEEATLTNGTLVFKEWATPSNSTPLYMSYYFFNITNADEILSKGAKPNVTQTGRLSYKFSLDKYNITFKNSSNTVSYYNKHTYVYDPSMSTLNETDEIIAPNYFFWTVLNSLNYSTEFAQYAVFFLNENANSTNETVRNGLRPFYRTTVQDLLWGTHGNAFLDVVKGFFGDADLSKKFGRKLDFSTNILTQMNFSTNIGMQTNGSNDGLHEVYTGYGNDNKNRGIHYAWNGKRTLSLWHNRQANMINGTDGTIFPTFMKKEKTLQMFSADVCRSVYMEEVGSLELQGLQTYKYRLPEEVFNVSYGANKGFCPKDRPCKDGLLDASECFGEQVLPSLPQIPGINLTLSVIISNPHFMYAGNDTQSAVNGMQKANESLYETYVDVQLETGIVLKAAKRSQFNTMLNQTDASRHIDSLKNLTSNWTQLMPIFWIEEELFEYKDVINEIKDKFITPQKIASILSYVCIGLGICSLMASLSIFICCPAKPEVLFLEEDNPLDSDRQMLIQSRSDSSESSSRRKKNRKLKVASTDDSDSLND